MFFLLFYLVKSNFRWPSNLMHKCVFVYFTFLTFFCSYLPSKKFILSFDVFFFATLFFFELWHLLQIHLSIHICIYESLCSIIFTIDLGTIFSKDPVVSKYSSFVSIKELWKLSNDAKWIHARSVDLMHYAHSIYCYFFNRLLLFKKKNIVFIF